MTHASGLERRVPAAAWAGVRPGSHRALFLALGLLQVAALAAFGWLDGIAMPLPRLLLPTTAFICYAVAGLATNRQTPPLLLLWGIAILARVVLLPLPPELSGDIYRYLWDGHVLLEGVNPYAHAPESEALAEIRTPWHGDINHPQVPTIYPPLAQLLFVVVNVVGGTVFAAKLVWLAFDLACGLLLQGIATRTGRNPATVLIWYLWSPLLIVETAWSGHFDAAGLCVMAALMWVAVRWPVRKRDAVESSGQDTIRRWRRPAALGTLLGLATLVKFAPAAALPPVARRYGVPAAASFAVVCAAFYLPFLGVGADALTEGLRTYARHWSANEGAFTPILHLLGDPVRARVAVTVLVAAVAGYATCRRFSVERALLWVIGAGILLSPTVHPWYVLWLLPMAALRSHAPFLLLGGLMFLGYWGFAAYEATGVWPQPGWNRAAMWVPVWGLLLWGMRPRRDAHD